MTDNVIEAKQLTKTYRSGLRRRSVSAVRDLDLTVARGEIVAFVGPNGAGKTTTILALLGLVRPDSGRVSVLGNSPGEPAYRRRLGFLSEIFYTYPFQTARQTMSFYGRLSRMDQARLEDAIPRQLSRLGLESAIDRRVGTFSKGMIQRLGLAQALLHRPELLILDEPTTGLDPQGRKLVADLIKEEKQRGATVFLSSHILSDVERSCDRVVMIRDGSVILSESLETLTRGADLWEVEVLGWTEAKAAQFEAAGFVPVRVDSGTACFSCDSARKQQLLRLILDASLEVGTVTSGGQSLEDLYMEHFGDAATG